MPESDRFVRVVFFDHDYQDSSTEAEIDPKPTVLAIAGRVTEDDDRFMVVALCDALEGENTRFGGKPMTVFRVFKPAIISITELRLKTGRKKKVQP